MSKYSTNFYKMKSNLREGIAMNKKEERLKVLQKNGIDTNNFILEIGKMTPNSKIEIVIGKDGKPQIIKTDNGEVENDPIIEEIFANNYVRNTRLHRRFILAQVWEALHYEYIPYVYNSATNKYEYQTWKAERGYDAWLRNKHDYTYQFTMMLEEVRVISKLEVSDRVAFEERSSFFTKDVVYNTCKDYLKKLRKHCDGLKRKHCKGVEYVTVGGENIFVADLKKKLFTPCEMAIGNICRASNYKELYMRLSSFVRNYVKKYKLPSNTKKCAEWIDAYKGSGAFYTLDNLCKWHNVFITNYNTGEVFKGQRAVNYLHELLDEYAGEGWRFMAMLKKTIGDNHFDLARSIEAHKE